MGTQTIQTDLSSVVNTVQKMEHMTPRVSKFHSLRNFPGRNDVNCDNNIKSCQNFNDSEYEKRNNVLQKSPELAVKN